MRLTHNINRGALYLAVALALGSLNSSAAAATFQFQLPAKGVSMGAQVPPEEAETGALTFVSAPAEMQTTAGVPLAYGYTYSLQNTGDGPLTVSSVSMANNPSGIAVGTDGCSGAKLQRGEGCSVTLGFASNSRRVIAGNVLEVATRTGSVVSTPITTTTFADLSTARVASVVASPSLVAGDSFDGELTAQVVDGYGNRVPDFPVAWASESPGGQVRALQSQTDDDGQAAIGIGSRTAGTAMFSARGATGSAQTVSTSVAIDEANLVAAVQVSKGVVKANGVDTVTVTATVSDKWGNRLLRAGVPVFHNVEGTYLAQAAASTLTDAQGVAVFAAQASAQKGVGSATITVAPESSNGQRAWSQATVELVQACSETYATGMYSTQVRASTQNNPYTTYEFLKDGWYLGPSTTNPNYTFESGGKLYGVGTLQGPYGMDMTGHMVYAYALAVCDL